MSEPSLHWPCCLPTPAQCPAGQVPPKGINPHNSSELVPTSQPPARLPPVRWPDYILAGLVTAMPRCVSGVEIQTCHGCAYLGSMIGAGIDMPVLALV